MPFCAVIACKNESKKCNYSKDGISFHGFPTCPTLKSYWIDAIGRSGWSPTKHSTVCSKHFLDSSFTYKKKRRTLCTDAVPTLFMQICPGANCHNGSTLHPTRCAHSTTMEEQPHGSSDIASRSGHVPLEKESKMDVFRVRAMHAGCSFPETRTFTLDQKVLLNLQELSDNIQSFYPTVRGKSFTIAFRGDNGDRCEYVFWSASGSRSKGEAHSGLRCDECGVSIAGFRYKCVTCEDYDLCGACEALGTHEQHLMIRIAHALKMKDPRAQVERWCDAMRAAGLPSDVKSRVAPEPAAFGTITDSCVEFSDMHDANYEIVCHQPVYLKSEPMDSEDDYEVSMTPTPVSQASCTSKKIIKQRPLLSKVIKKKPVVQRETTLKKETLPASRVSSGLKTPVEPFISIDKVKIEEPDPLGPDTFLEPTTNDFVINQQYTINAEVGSILQSGTQCLVVNGDQQWLLQSAHAVPGALVAQSGPAVAHIGTNVAQEGINVVQSETSVARDGTNVENSGTLLGPGGSKCVTVGGQIIVTPSTKENLSTLEMFTCKR